MAVLETLIYKFFLIVGGVLLVVEAINKKWQIKEVIASNDSKIANEISGLVSIQATVWPIKKPIRNRSGQNLVYFRFTIRKIRTLAGDGPPGDVVFSRDYNDPFFIIDSTGVAIADLKYAELNLRPPRVFDWAKLSAEDKSFYLVKLAGKSPQGFPPKDGILNDLVSPVYSITEEEIKVGESINLIGVLNKKAQIPIEQDELESFLTSEEQLKFRNQTANIGLKALGKFRPSFVCDSDKTALKKKLKNYRNLSIIAGIAMIMVGFFAKK